MDLNGEMARSLLLAKLKSGKNIDIGYRAWVEAKKYLSLTKDGIIAESITNLENDIDIHVVTMANGSAGWVIKPMVNNVQAYFKYCFEDNGSIQILKIVSAHQ